MPFYEGVRIWMATYGAAERAARGEPSLDDLARVRVDWTVRGDVRAALLASIKRLLRKYKYPPDQTEGTVKQVIEQMEILAPGMSTPPGPTA